MTYLEAFRDAVHFNNATGNRMFVYKALWDGSYFATRYIVPVPHLWAVLIGEVGRRTGR
jgi:hypothetical protein